MQNQNICNIKMDHNFIGNCKFHDDFPILFYCTDPKCNNASIPLNNNITQKALCEICLNLHDKSHKFIISSNSILDETYDKMINSNIEKAAKVKVNIEKLYKIFTEQISNEFKSFTEKFIILIEKSKADLINSLELQKNKAFEEIEIWKDLKIKLEKFSLYNLKTIKSSNLNLNPNIILDNSLEIDDSKFIQELNFLGSDRRNNMNNSNTDINLSCLSKEENLNNVNFTKDNFNFNLNSNVHLPSMINVNTQLNNFKTETFVPGESNNNFNNANFMSNNYFLENKLKLISFILEKHIEQFVNNGNNYSNSISDKNLFGTSDSKKEYNSNNSFKFSQNVKNILKNFNADLDFKLKNLLEYNMPLSAYAQNSSPNVNTNGLSSKNIFNNRICNNENIQPINSSRNTNGVYSNTVKNINFNNNINKNHNNEDMKKSESIKPNEIKRNRSDNVICNANEENININIMSPCNNLYNNNNNDNNNNKYEILDKNVAAYGNKRYISNNDQNTFIFDANGGEYSPKNSMILNFNTNNNKKNLELDALISTREQIYKNNSIKDNQNNNINNNNDIGNLIIDSNLKHNMQISPEINLLSEMPAESSKNLNVNLKETEDLRDSEIFELNNFEQQKKATKKRAPSVKGSAYRDDAYGNNNNNKNKNSIRTMNENLKNNNSNNLNSNPIKILSDENILNNEDIADINDNHNRCDAEGKNNNKIQNVNRNHVTRTNNLRSVSNYKKDENNKNSNEIIYKNILENKKVNSVLTNIKEKSLNILSGSNKNLTHTKHIKTNDSVSELGKKESEEVENEEKRFSKFDKINNLSKNDENRNNKKENCLIKNFNHKTFELLEPEDILTSKKGSWYSLDYIESHDYLVCGFENGEIIIFKASDYSLIRTYRPRFKRIRRLIYSAENSSVFVCYDDGYFIVINILDLKFESLKKSENQIYAFDIMKNYNILIWGGYDKKIMFSHISNLDVTQLFWESKHGEIQAIYHDLNSDVLIASFRKNKIAFFNFKNTQIIKQFSIEENDDACGMVIKKYEFENSKNNYEKNYKKSTILISGFFMCIHQFEISITEDNKEKVDFIRYIRTPYTHIYDIIFLNEKYFLISTFEEGKIVLLDFNDNKIIKVFEHFYKSVLQIKFVKDKFYLTSHGDFLKKVDFEM